MDWLQVFTIVVSVFGLFLWVRRESATDRRQHAAEMKEVQKEIKLLSIQQAKLDERYQNFITSLFAQFSKEDLKKSALKNNTK